MSSALSRAGRRDTFVFIRHRRLSRDLSIDAGNDAAQSGFAITSEPA
jgi:hypothetical protein